MKNYTEKFKVKWHEIDLDKKLRPYAFMNMAQECANVHSAALKFGYEDLMEYNQVWVLSRIIIKYIHPPLWGDSVEMTTWHKGKHGLFWLRDFDLHREENGLKLAVATSSWVIMNINTRHVERKSVFEQKEDVINMSWNVNAIDTPCDKIIPAKNLSFVREFKVKNSDIDFNRHANNAKYIEWITDSVSSSFLDNFTISEIQVNYLQEAHLDDNIKLYASEYKIDEGIIEIYYEGKRESSLLFQAKAIYKLKKH